MPQHRLPLWPERDRLKGDYFPKRKIFVAPSTTPEVVALRRKIKSFQVVFKPVEQVFEGGVVQATPQLSLLLENVPGGRAIVLLPETLQDEIETMNGGAAGRQPLADRPKAICRRFDWQMLENRDGEDGVEGGGAERLHKVFEIAANDFHIRK